MMYHIRTEKEKVSLFDEQNHIGYFESVHTALDYLRDELHEILLMDTVLIDIDGRLHLLTQKRRDER